MSAAAAAIVDCFDLDLPLPGPVSAHSLIGINWGREEEEEGGLVVAMRLINFLN